MLRVTPIYGSRWDGHGPAPKGSCTLLEYANVRVLVNIGGPAIGGYHTVESLKEQLPEHDCLVLSDSSLESMGSLPLYCQAFWGKNQDNNTTGTHRPAPPPIYATFPTVKMGQMTLWDYHAHISLDGGRPPFTLEQMDYAISKLNTIKYSQSINIQGRLSITAHSAGHIVGGAFWVLQRIQDETVVVITSTYSIAKEKHLDSSTLLKYGTTPDVLVTRPGGPAMPLVRHLLAQQQQQSKEKHLSPSWTMPVLVSQAQKLLTETIMSVLRRDGNVLLPVDASGRVLELILLLDQHWEKQRLKGTYHLVWLGPMVGNTLDFARSQLEWMNGKLGHQFDSNAGGSGGTGQHPYALKQVHMCTNVSELETFLATNPNPVCVVANGMTLDHGPARDLLLKWADNDNHAILFTDTAQCLERDQEGQDSITGSATSAVMGTTTTTATATTTTGTLAATESSLQAAQQLQGVPSSAAATATAMMGSTAGTSNSATTGAGAVALGGPTATEHATEAETTAEEGQDEDDDTTNRGRLISKAQASKYTTAFQLMQHWCQAKLEGREMEDRIDVDVLVPRRAPLVGNELNQFLELEEQARLSKRQKEEQAAMLREVELAKGRLRLGEQQQTQPQTPQYQQQTQQQMGAKENDQNSTMAAATKNPNLKFFRPKKKNRFDSNLFLKFSKPLHLTFGYVEDAVGLGQEDATSKLFGGNLIGDYSQSDVLEDDYGIAVDNDHFVDIVTGVDPSKFSGGSGRIGDEVLRRGLGFGASAVDPTMNDSSRTTSKKKKRKTIISGENDYDDDDDDETALDERGLEAMDLSEGRGIIRGRNGRPPTKVMTESRRIQVYCEIDYIPLEGRVDSRAARQSVRALQPRQVVVLGGTRPEKSSSPDDDDNYNKNNNETTMTMDTDDENKEKEEEEAVLMTTDDVRVLAQAAESFTTTQNKVHCPNDSEMAELNVGHAAYSVRLVATPYRTKEEREQEEEPPEPMELHEAKLGACTVSFLDYVATGQRVASDGSVVLAPRKKENNRTSNPNQQLSIYLSDGDVLLTDLRTELIAQGMKAEYSTHSGFARLVINGKVVVKKDNDSGRVHVEGALCEDYFTVRSIVCGQYVTL